MIGPIQLFQSLRQLYQTMGIYSPKAPNQRVSFNLRILFFLFVYTQLFISSILFILFEAESTLEFGASFYAVLAELFCIWYFLIKMWQMPRISQLFAGFEVLIDKSKWIAVSNSIDFEFIFYFFPKNKINLVCIHVNFARNARKNIVL